ncbi:MAG: putative quinol monooxygenase [Trebonia sp.]
MAVTSILDLRLKSDSLETALTVIHETLVATRARPGCLGVSVLVDSGDPAHVILLETWESIEHDRAYREWRAGGGAAASDLPSVLAAPPQLTVFTVAEGV